MAIVLTTAQKAFLDQVDAALDQLFLEGAEYPAATPVIPPMPEYDRLKSFFDKGDVTPGVRQVFTAALLAAGGVGGAVTPVAPTLINSWANSGGSEETAGYYRDASGIVHLQGTITGGTANTVAFVLPAGYRPAKAQSFAVAATISGANAAHFVKVDASGNVTVTLPSVTINAIGLNGISFLAA